MIEQYLPWLLSAITIYTMFLAGNVNRWTWAVGLANQALWLIWIFAAEAWGLIPMNIALWVVYARNHLKWNGDVKEPMMSIREPIPDWMLDPIPRRGVVVPPTIPVPVNRQHAEMMLVVAQRYLDDNPK